MIQSFVKRIAPLAALAMSAGLAGCGDVSVTINGEEGVPLSELDMSGDAPTELLVAGPDRVVVTEGDELDITVEGDDEDLVRFVLDDKMLGVTRKDGDWDFDGQITVRVTMPAPTEIEALGSGSVEAATVADDAEVNIRGSGSVAVEQVDVESLETNIWGSGSIRIAGTADRLEASTWGSGGANLAGLTADDAEISIYGSGGVNLASDGKVDASIMGSGSVHVTGSAQCSVSAMGSGSITCKPASDSGDAEDGESDESTETAEAS